MLSALAAGVLAALPLLIGALIAYHARPGQGPIAVVMALGAGLLIGSVSFELVDEALETKSLGLVAGAVLAGAAVFSIGDWVLTRGGAAARKDSTGEQREGSPVAIVFGSVLDGIPEAFVLGLSVLLGEIGIAFVTAVILSNLAEGLASSSGLRLARWPERRVLVMWAIVVAASGVAAVAGYVLLEPQSGRTGGLAQAFAAGALLAMVADTMLPESYEVEGAWTGFLVVAAFAASLALSSA
jgi:zinc transporter, ZIP family